MYNFHCLSIRPHLDQNLPTMSRKCRFCMDITCQVSTQVVELEFCMCNSQKKKEYVQEWLPFGLCVYFLKLYPLMEEFY